MGLLVAVNIGQEMEVEWSWYLFHGMEWYDSWASLLHFNDGGADSWLPRRLMHEIDVDGSGTVNYTELRSQLSASKWQLMELPVDVFALCLCHEAVVESEVHCSQHLKEAVPPRAGVLTPQSSDSWDASMSARTLFIYQPSCRVRSTSAQSGSLGERAAMKVLVSSLSWNGEVELEDLRLRSFDVKDFHVNLWTLVPELVGKNFLDWVPQE